MSYIKTNWVNGSTPLNATNMNHIEDGLVSLEGKIDGKVSANPVLYGSGNNVVFSINMVGWDDFDVETAYTRYTKLISPIDFQANKSYRILMTESHIGIDEYVMNCQQMQTSEELFYYFGDINGNEPSFINQDFFIAYLQENNEAVIYAFIKKDSVYGQPTIEILENFKQEKKLSDVSLTYFPYSNNQEYSKDYNGATIAESISLGSRDKLFLVSTELPIYYPNQAEIVLEWNELVYPSKAVGTNCYMYYEYDWEQPMALFVTDNNWSIEVDFESYSGTNTPGLYMWKEIRN